MRLKSNLKIFCRLAIAAAFTGCATQFTYRLGFEPSPMTLDEFSLEYTEDTSGQFTECKVRYTGTEPAHIKSISSDNSFFTWSGESGYICPGQSIAVTCEKSAKNLAVKIPNTAQIKIRFTRAPEYKCPGK
jgi:hypothetical protein